MALVWLDLNGDEVVHRQQQFRIFRDRKIQWKISPESNSNTATELLRNSY